jgi:integrase
MPKLTKRAVEALTARDRPYDIRDSDLRGFLVRIEPGGTKSFFLDYRLRGKRNRYRLGAYPNLSAEGARALTQAIAGDVARGTDPQARKKAEREQGIRERLSTLRAFLDGRYEPWARAHLKSATLQLARLRSDFAEQLDQPLYAFNPFVIEGMRLRWKKAGLLPRTINRDIQRLQSVLARAAEWGVIDRHPLYGLKPMKADKTGRVRFLTGPEEASLRKALTDREERLRQARVRFNTWRIARARKPLPERTGENLDHLRPMVLLALNTGMRRGELLSLQWSDVNLAAKLVTVTGVNAKSGHTRRIPLNAEALAVLEGWQGRQERTDGLVFPGADGGRMDNINRSWRGVASAAKLVDFKFHDLRHSFASKLVQAGVDLYTVKELLGHSEIAMTEKYSHLAPDNLRAAVERIAQ